MLTGRYAGQVTENELRVAFCDEAVPNAEIAQDGVLLRQEQDAKLTVYGMAFTAAQPLRLSFAGLVPIQHLEFVREPP